MAGIELIPRSHFRTFMGWTKAVRECRAESWKVEMARRTAAPTQTVELRFDPAVFFQFAAEGRSISTYRKNEIIFSQGDGADAVFYIKKGKVKVTVVSQRAPPRR